MPAAELPVPPPFMWGCRSCTDLLTELATAFALAATDALYDGAVRCQLMLARHLANAHPGDIPAPHPDCDPCAYYEKWADTQGCHDLWLEHRARELFLPAGDARLM